MGIANLTILSTDISVAGNICYGTSLNRAAGFTSYPTRIMLTGAMGYNEFGAPVTYDLPNQNAYVEIIGTITSSTMMIYQSYVFIYNPTGNGQLVAAVTSANNNANITIGSSVTGSTVSFSLYQQGRNDTATFLVKITAFPQSK